MRSSWTKNEWRVVTAPVLIVIGLGLTILGVTGWTSSSSEDATLQRWSALAPCKTPTEANCVAQIPGLMDHYSAGVWTIAFGSRIQQVQLPKIQRSAIPVEGTHVLVTLIDGNPVRYTAPGVDLAPPGSPFLPHDAASAIVGTISGLLLVSWAGTVLLRRLNREAFLPG